MHHEAELAVVIGRMCREVPRERVKDVILGYTCANDVTARDVQQREKQWARAKGFDTSCPLGPWVETELDLAGDLTITVHGQRRTAAGRPHRADDPLHRGPDRQHHRGDDPAPGRRHPHRHPGRASARSHVGDEVAVTIEGIGTLTNKVIKRG